MNTYNPVPFDPQAYVDHARSADAEFIKAYDQLADEFEALSVLLELRQRSGLTQTEIADRMGVSQPAIARIERSLVTRKHVPSFDTLRRYAQACGQRLIISFEPVDR